MSQPFKLRFDQMLESDPTSPQEIPEKLDGQGIYQLPGSIRNLGFVWPDGKRSFHQYAYLPDGFFDPTGERNLIKLLFSSFTVFLYGYELESLFKELFVQLPEWIVINDPRYVTEHEACVVEVIIEAKER